MSALKVFYHGLSNKNISPITVGRLLYKKGLAYLEFSDEFLSTGLNISPLNLKLNKNLQIAPRTPFNGLHGVFADSLPDGWGLLLMDRYFRQKQMQLSHVTPLDRLSYLGSRTMGALSYQPDLGEENIYHPQDIVSLDNLASESMQIYQGSKKEISKQLQIEGGTPGGARPKATIGLKNDQAISGADDLPDGYQHWLVKFPTGKSETERAEGVVEYIYAIMAKAAGIDFPETQLIEAHQCSGYFACQRFDRSKNNQRIHLHSFAGLMNADFRVPDSDYELLMRATSHITQNHPDLCEVFRRMIFNILSGNRDDHTKNFSFLMAADGTWRLSPAYDLTFNHGINGHHSMSIKGFGKDIPMDAILRIAKMIPLGENKMNAIIEEVADALSQWRALANTYEVPIDLIEEIENYIHIQFKRLTINA